MSLTSTSLPATVSRILYLRWMIIVNIFSYHENVSGVKVIGDSWMHVPSRIQKVQKTAMKDIVLIGAAAAFIIVSSPARLFLTIVDSCCGPVTLIRIDNLQTTSVYFKVQGLL